MASKWHSVRLPALFSNYQMLQCRSFQVQFFITSWKSWLDNIIEWWRNVITALNTGFTSYTNPTTSITYFFWGFYIYLKKKMVAIFIEKTNTKHQRLKEEAHQALQASYWVGPYLRRPIYKSPWKSPSQSQGPRATNHILQDILCSSQ